MFSDYTEEVRQSRQRIAAGDYCAECGEPFQRTRPNRDFCSPACQKTHNARRISGGLQLYNAVMRWRIDRPKNALAELTQIADFLASEERSIRLARILRIKQIKREKKI
jgi:hypothetical protein